MGLPIKPFEVWRKYKSLVQKMPTNTPKKNLVWENLDLLCDLELVLDLPCIFPMLEVVHT
jgi:hypothetical protein